MPCDNAAVWLVDRTGKGLQRLCDECIRYRHCGQSFSLIRRVQGACQCTHMPARMEQDRAARGIESKGAAA
jgi:hypothetical protein